MSKILITGDIHIHDYRNHNLFDDPQFRLKQFDKLADRLVNLCQGSKAEAIIIAGDFLHVANPRPYIVNAAFAFLEKLSEYMDVYLTHGQHDYDSRTSMDGQHTLLTLCNRIPRVSYLHKQRASIGDTAPLLFYFLGWEPDFRGELDAIAEPYDVLIGHAQPGEVSVGQRGLRMFGGESLPEPENSGYSIAFLGDIHYHQSKSNWVIPGTPIQHSYNDSPDVGVILFDTATMDWKRLPTLVPKHWEFLQLLITDESSKNPYVVSRPKTSTEIVQFQGEVYKSLDTMTIIQKTIEETELEELHTELLGSVPKNVRDEVNLNFQLEHVKIQNFRSIADFEWGDINEGVKLVSGRNGTGKSSLVSAVMFALSGTGSARTLTQNGKKNMFVEVSFLYGRLRHTIRRGWATSGKTQYFINGEEVPAENQRALSAKLSENLPFLDFTDMFYHEQDRPGFLASYNYTARVDLVSRVLGLKIVNELQDAALNKTVFVDNELASIREKIASVTSIVDQESLVDFSILEMVDEATENNLRILMEATKKLLDEEKRRWTSAIAEEATLASRIQRATNDVAESETRRQAVEGERCYTCGQRLHGEEYTTVLGKINEEIANIQGELAICVGRRESLDISPDRTVLLETKYQKVNSRLSEAIALRDHAESLAALKISIDNAKEKRVVLDEELAKVTRVKESLDTYRKVMDSNGPVMRSLLTSVSELLTSDTLRVRAHKQLVSGELRPDFGVDMLVPGQGWIAYDELSGGQKTVSDLMILEKMIRLVGGVGLLIFDETFKYLDNENLEHVVDIIKMMQCHSTFVVSHAEGFPYWDHAVQTKVDKSGNTSYTMR